jgi:hypothetical protein
MREEIFVLTYKIPGMTYADIMGMVGEEVEWYIDRLYKQLKAEVKAMKRK